jgi:2-dehydro-3-deoxyphosphogluconate aldolase/(4S)-4-hydroxy-2-oxoglutarate aldolase
MNSLITLLARTPVLPVVTIDDARSATPLAQALLRGGINAIEVTLRTQAGLESIAQIAKQVPDMLVGAGTVLTS